jgi:UDP-N-acetylmuramoyl-tripeptide--D-alanyl-D-alanine ligase
MKPTIGWFCESLHAAAPGLISGMELGPISIDTRTIQAGDTFWALVSQRDGHDFIPVAFDRGAKSAVVSTAWLRSDLSAPYRGRVIAVEDTSAALTTAASMWRALLPCPVLGITGTNGKTSTKDCILHIVRESLVAVGTGGNYNNEIGVPLTLLSIPSNAGLAVVEMGASHPGDISYLCNIANPTMGLVTSIGRAHLEGFGSPEAIAATKGELYDYLSTGGLAFVPCDDALCVAESAMCRNRIGYGFDRMSRSWTGEFHLGEDLRFDELGRAQFRFDGQPIALSIPGRPAALSALAALTVAAQLGVAPAAAQSAVHGWTATRGRTSIQALGKIVLMDDSYNANPTSMRAALETLCHLAGRRRVAVLGDMNELGSYAEDEHRKLGETVAHLGIQSAVFLGRYASVAAEAAQGAMTEVHAYPTYDELDAELPDLIRDGDAVLVKGSRSMKLERAIETLKRVFA